MVQSVSERQADRPRPTTGERKFSGERHVAVLCEVELPVHLEVPGKIGPAVALAYVSTRRARERHRRTNRQPGALLLGGENLPTAHLENVGVVAPAADLEMRGAKDKDAQPRQPRLVAEQAGVLEQTGEMGIRDDVFHEPVPPISIRCGHPIAQGVVADPRESRDGQVAPLLVKEARPVGDEVLEVPDLWAVDGGIVTLGHNPVPERKPETAGSSIGGADAILAARGPPRGEAGMPERFPMPAQCGHRQTQSRQASTTRWPMERAPESRLPNQVVQLLVLS